MVLVISSLMTVINSDEVKWVSSKVKSQSKAGLSTLSVLWTSHSVFFYNAYSTDKPGPFNYLFFFNVLLSVCNKQPKILIF